MINHLFFSQATLYDEFVEGKWKQQEMTLSSPRHDCALYNKQEHII
jgi:hypothetical protein